MVSVATKQTKIAYACAHPLLHSIQCSIACYVLYTVLSCGLLICQLHSGLCRALFELVLSCLASGFAGMHSRNQSCQEPPQSGSSCASMPGCACLRSREGTTQLRPECGASSLNWVSIRSVASQSTQAERRYVAVQGSMNDAHSICICVLSMYPSMNLSKHFADPDLGVYVHSFPA